MPVAEGRNWCSISVTTSLRIISKIWLTSKLASLRKLPVQTVVCAELGQDHKPSNQDSYSTRVVEQVVDALDSNDGADVALVAVKKNSLNMRSSYTDVLTPISDHFVDEDIDILIVNDEADAATAMKDPEEYNQCMMC